MPIITITNQKGGTGKTTTAISLAHGLAKQGHHVLLLDLDPQGHLATVLGLPQAPGVYDWIVRDRPLPRCIANTGRPGLTLLPGNKKTASAITYLAIEHRGAVPLELIADRLRPALRNGLRYVVVDTAPSASELQAAALYAADLLLIPAACEFLSQEGAADVLNTLDLLGHNGAIHAAILPTMYDERANASRAALDVYKALGDIPVLDPIHHATRFRDAVAAGQTIFEIEPNGRPANEYAAAVWWVRDHV